MQTEEKVVVETTSGLMQAQIIKGLLESRGLSVTLSHESAVTVISLSVGPLAEVDILVPVDQREQAQALLRDFHAGLLEIELDTTEGAEGESSVLDDPG